MMKIGILGTRGIPNAYGGFEQFAQYLAVGLQKKGYDVSVYNSSNHPYKHDTWEGIRIIHCKDWEDNIGASGQFIFDFNCIVDARNRNFDILLQLGYTSNSVWHFIWPRKAVNIVNLDGLEWKRSKYSSKTQKFLQLAEKLAVNNGDVLIADSIGIQQYVTEKYQKHSHYIPYGAEVFNDPVESEIEQLSLRPYKYLLLIARMEPENNVETIIKGYLLSGSTDPLVVVGNPENKFGTYLRQNYDYPNVRFVGAIYDFRLLNNLRFYSKIYFHGHSVGGTNPSLLEAMACHCNIVAHSNLFNRAILEQNGTYFLDDLEVAQCIAIAQDPEHRRINGEVNVEKIRTLYSWETIVNKYEALFIESFNQRKQQAK